MRKGRIGLFGGTFNPIHCGHLKAAEIIGRRFSLDEILFIPSHIPPHKSSREIASPQDRLQMVMLAVRGYPRFVASPIEVEAREKSYSIITLNKVKKLYPESWILFILGVDAFVEIKTWKSYEEVLKQCLFIVMSRPGYRMEEAGHVLSQELKDRVYALQESEEIREALFSNFKIFLVAINALDLSSTEIRRKIKKGERIKDMVPDAVRKYIREKKLYRD